MCFDILVSCVIKRSVASVPWRERRGSVSAWGVDGLERRLGGGFIVEEGGKRKRRKFR